MWPTWRRRPGSLPELVPATQAALRQWIPDYLRVSNPVDNGGAPSIDWRGRKILDAIVADPDVAVLICPITGALPSMSRLLAEDLVAVAATTDKPICVIWGSPLTDDPAHAEVLLPSACRCSARSATASVRCAPTSTTTASSRVTGHPSLDRSDDGPRPLCSRRADGIRRSAVGARAEAGARAVRGPGHRRRPRRLGRRGRSAAGGLGYPV